MFSLEEMHSSMSAVPQDHPGMQGDTDRTSPAAELLQGYEVGKQLALSEPWVD